MLKTLTSLAVLALACHTNAGFATSPIGVNTIDISKINKPVIADEIEWTYSIIDKNKLKNEDAEKLRKLVSQYKQNQKDFELPRELQWLSRQCKGEACASLNKYLVELPAPTKKKLSKALRYSGVASKGGIISSTRLVKQIEGILGNGKIDEFQVSLKEELTMGLDIESETVEIEGYKVKLDRIGNQVFMDHDMLLGEFSDTDLKMASIGYTYSLFPGFPWWINEEMWKAILRLLQGNIDYWPVVPRGTGRRRVDVPFKIQSDLSRDKEDDVAMALARMCLETALPLPDWMEGENFTRSFITALTAGALKGGVNSCRNLINGINDALGENMGRDFILNLIPRTTQVSYINFRYHASRCSSPVGMNPTGPNNVNVADWCGVGSLMHETLHSLGFYHQQSRNDRENHIDVLWENIVDDREHNYETRDFLFAGVPYDYFSILHYSRINGFSIGGAPTMNATPFGVPPGPVYDLLQATYNGAMGQRDGMSSSDLDSLHGVY